MSVPHEKGKRKRRLGIAIAVILFFVIVVIFAHSALMRLVLIPPYAYSSWVEDIAAPALFFHEGISSMTLAQVDAKFGPQRAAELRRTNEQKRKFYATWKSGNGRYGLRRSYSTVEGDRIVEWWLVRNGVITLVHDATRDEYGRWPGVERHHPGVKIGVLGPQGFVEGDPGPDSAAIIVLRFDHLAQGDVH